jgi:hypothetical protein
VLICWWNYVDGIVLSVGLLVDRLVYLFCVFVGYGCLVLFACEFLIDICWFVVVVFVYWFVV